MSDNINGPEAYLAAVQAAKDAKVALEARLHAIEKEREEIRVLLGRKRPRDPNKPKKAAKAKAA